MKKISFLILAAFLICQISFAQNKIALLKYRGGGDWYSVVDALQNLVKFSNKELNMNFSADYSTVDVGSPEMFNYAFLFMTGHGNVVMSDEEALMLRQYLIGGGFLFIDDDYGMEKFVRPAMKKVFPELNFEEIPFEHPVYHQKFNFSKGVPKIHEHDGKAPQLYGLLWQGRVVALFGYESNISDGWESKEVHKVSDDLRLQALKMGSNILQFAFMQ